jgi:hypothetical protein
MRLMFKHGVHGAHGEERLLLNEGVSFLRR